jgi:hypothetical protein
MVLSTEIKDPLRVYDFADGAWTGGIGGMASMFNLRGEGGS